MLAAMRASIALSLLLLVAADSEASPSLRGGHTLAETAKNATTGAVDEAHAAVAGAVVDELWEEDLSGEAGSGLVDAGANGSESIAADLADLMGLARNLSVGFFSEEGSEAVLPEDNVEALLLWHGGWSQGGDKVWGGGRGTESITRRNVGYYNKGMYAARAHCGGGRGCALITNPMGHRSVRAFHIHFVHYHGYGARLHKKLESKVCGRHGWRRGGLPCAGKAAYFPGFPGVFSAAMGGGNIGSASVVAWPASCGGRGTIVQLAFGCSIEHKIRGDYKRGFR